MVTGRHTSLTAWKAVTGTSCMHHGYKRVAADIAERSCFAPLKQLQGQGPGSSEYVWLAEQLHNKADCQRIKHCLLKCSTTSRQLIVISCDFIFLTKELSHWEGFASHLFHVVACHDDAHWPERGCTIPSPFWTSNCLGLQPVVQTCAGGKGVGNWDKPQLYWMRLHAQSHSFSNVINLSLHQEHGAWPC